MARSQKFSAFLSVVHFSCTKAVLSPLLAFRNVCCFISKRQERRSCGTYVRRLPTSLAQSCVVKQHGKGRKINGPHRFENFSTSQARLYLLFCRFFLDR